MGQTSGSCRSAAAAKKGSRQESCREENCKKGGEESRQEKIVSKLGFIVRIPTPEQERNVRFRRDMRKFYALVGHCILVYQSVEDFLDNVFAAFDDGDEKRASAIFSSVLGIDAKIRIIQAAAIGSSENVQVELAALLKRVKAASETRGKIAHARPVQNQGLIEILVRTEEGRVVESLGSRQVSPARWELHKDGKQSVVFSVDDLRAEYHKADDLFDDLINFLKDLADARRP